jgi:hypothetical protein
MLSEKEKKHVAQARKMNIFFLVFGLIILIIANLGFVRLQQIGLKNLESTTYYAQLHQIYQIQPQTFLEKRLKEELIFSKKVNVEFYLTIIFLGQITFFFLLFPIGAFYLCIWLIRLKYLNLLNKAMSDESKHN